MNIEKYTDRAKGFLQAAQTIAMREGHPQFTPEHVLKALLDDGEGMAAGLIDRSGGPAAGGRSLRLAEEAWRQDIPLVEFAAENPDLRDAFHSFAEDSDRLYPGWREKLKV